MTGAAASEPGPISRPAGGPERCVPLTLILAGGVGSRMGGLGHVLPKSLIPVSTRQTALSRLLDQLAGLGTQRVIVSTAPVWASQIISFVERLRAIEDLPMNVTVEVNPAHTLGCIPALRFLADKYASDDYLLCLGDVVFLQNPFHVFAEGVFRNALLVAAIETGRGGVAEHSSGALHGLYYESRDCPFRPGFSYANWSGTACLPGSALADPGAPAADPLESLVTVALSRGAAMTVLPSADFINLNTPDDLRRCWASDLT